MAALTAEQIAARRFGIGSSDAPVIARGDEKELYELWLEKTGRSEPKPKLREWDAALRHHVEPLILDWYTIETAVPVERRGDVVVCDKYNFLRATLDGWAGLTIQKPIDAKFLSGWTPGNAYDWAREHYSWQIVHQCICTGCERGGILAVVADCKKPEWLDVPFDEFAAATYIDRAKAFWAYVRNDVEPPGAPPLAVPVAPEKMRVVDMTGNNAWAVAAGLWRENRTASQVFDKAAKDLKALVELDVKEAFGAGVVARRDKRGISLKEG